MPRKQAQLRGPKDRELQNRSQNKNTKRNTGKGLDALSIAEAEYPINPRIRRSRLGVGDDDDFSKRKRDDTDGPDNKRRRTGEDDSGDNDGSDGDGREWKIGEVDSDDDEELDSDEAMGSSDEELFEGFAFRGSSTTNSKPKPKQNKEKKTRQINLDESDEDMNKNEEDDDEDDDLGEDAVDLLTAWDMNTAAEEEDAKKAAAKAKKAATDDYDEESSSQDEEDSDDESSEDDDDALSASDDDADAGNEHGLSRLQNFVNSMETDTTSKPTKKKGFAQEQSKPTEYGLTSSKKLTVADLLPSISDSRLKSSLKHVDATADHKQSSGIPGKLDAPAPKRQQDRMDREAAYEKSKETMDRWLETVKANRRAEHLVFPLPNPDAQLVHKLDAPKPQNDLESTIQNILVESGLATTQGKSNEDEVREFEELEGRKLPIEEIRERRAELRKRRELMFREEVRAKRIKKIKSKSYRRVHRKERERLEQQERQALTDAGIDLDEEEKEKMERQRAEARMSSKHKDSKWAKSLRQTGRTAWDEEARLGAVGQALKEEELRKRIEGKRVSNGDDDYLEPSSSESEDEDPWAENGSDVEKDKIRKKISALGDGDAGEEYKGPHAKLLSMKFMQNAEAARKEQNDAELRKLNRDLQGGEESQSEAESEVGRRMFGQNKAEKPEQKPKPFRKNEFEEAPDSDDEDAIEPKATETTQATSKPKPSARPAKKDAPARISGNISKQQETIDEVEENPWLVQTNRANRKANVNDSNQSVDISINDAFVSPPAPTPKSSNISKGQKSKAPAVKKPQIAEEAGSDDEGQVPVLLKNHDLVKRAFAGDEVVQEFEQEKLDTIEDEGDKVVDNTLPGWGSWAGEGVSKKQQKRQRRHLTTVEGVKPEQRKDAKLSKVIINEKRQKKVSQAQWIYVISM